MKKTLALVCVLLLASVNAWAQMPCTPKAPRSLDGSCNNLNVPSLGAVDTPLLHLSGEHYARGKNEALFFMRETPHEPGEPNPYPYVPTPEAPEGTCGPPGFVPECRFTIVTTKIKGIGAKSKYNPRILSNVLHDIASPLAPMEPQPNPAGLTNLAARVSQMLAHDLQMLQPTVSPRPRRHGFANQSDSMNPTILSGVPVVDPLDPFNQVSVFTPSGVPESPQFRAIIIAGPKPISSGRTEKAYLQFPNVASAFIDGDPFYGHTRQVLDKIRSHKGGKLLLMSLKSPRVGPVPPITIPGFPPSLAETGLRDPTLLDGMEAFTPSYADDRDLSTIGTAVVHVLWLRFHNLQANLCRDRYPDADPLTSEGDEVLFNCARKWTLAVYQHIIFDEFIPALTGRPLPGYRGYNAFVNPQGSLEAILGPLSLHSTPAELSPIARPDGTVDTRLQIELPGQPNPPAGNFPFIGSLFPTESATAAFYLALSGIPAPLGDPDDPTTKWVLKEDPVAQQIRGLAYFAHEPNDMAVIDSQRNIPANYGFDLVANNTFRNQQFGVANYYQARRRFIPGAQGWIYGQQGCPAWLQFKDDVDDPLACFERITADQNIAQLIKEQLKHPLLGVKAKIKHIPLFSGVLMEPKLDHGIWGITGRAIIEDQFCRVRDGDRYYFRNQMSADEIAQVDSYSMAKVIRAVLGEDVGVQDDVFHIPPDGFF